MTNPRATESTGCDLPRPLNSRAGSEGQFRERVADVDQQVPGRASHESNADMERLSASSPLSFSRGKLATLVSTS